MSGQSSVAADFMTPSKLFERDFEWAYGNLGNENAEEDGGAPSLTALELWRHGRTARTQFVKMAMDYFTRRSKVEAELKEFADDQRGKFNWIAKLRMEKPNVEEGILTMVDRDPLVVQKALQSLGWVVALPAKLAQRGKFA